MTMNGIVSIKIYQCLDTLHARHKSKIGDIYRDYILY